MKFRLLDATTRHDVLGGAVDASNAHLIRLTKDSPLEGLEIGGETNASLILSEKKEQTSKVDRFVIVRES